MMPSRHVMHSDLRERYLLQIVASQLKGIELTMVSCMDLAKQCHPTSMSDTLILIEVDRVSRLERYRGGGVPQPPPSPPTDLVVSLTQN